MNQSVDVTETGQCAGFTKNNENNPYYTNPCLSTHPFICHKGKILEENYKCKKK